jgi:hypothetical protein
LVDGLTIVSDDLNIAWRKLLLLHEASRAFSVNRTHRVVQATELEKVEFVFKRPKHVVSDSGRPFITSSGLKGWPNRQTVFTDSKINQNGVDAVKR